VPGRSFSRGELAGLGAYFRQLTEEGVEGVTAPRGAYGLTRKQYEAVHADLAQRLGVATKRRPLAEIVTQLSTRLALPLAKDASAAARFERGQGVDDVGEFAIGTGLAILLRAEGLALRPVVDRGQLKHRIVPRSGRARPWDGADRGGRDWPIGYRPEVRLSQVLPILLERITVQIEGYTLAEALDALRERLDVPLFVDHAGLSAARIDPAQIEVRFPPRKASYKRILDNILFQAKLQGEVRLDERGKAFYWITTATRRELR
jgi:hypothetical protein